MVYPVEDQRKYHLLHDEESHPTTVVRFDPDDGVEVVMFSTPRYAVVSADEEQVAWFDEESDAVADVGERNAEIGASSDEDVFFIDDAFESDTRPDWFYEGGFYSKWHSTDAWRGYSVPVYDDSIYEPFAAGWVTGYPDESTANKMTAADLHNGLYDGSLVPPFPVVWFFGMTSNVFSQTSDILIPVGKAGEFATWLESVGFDPIKVEEAFH